MPEWIVTSAEAGLQPEAFLQQRLPAAPQGYLRKLLKDEKLHRSGNHDVATPLEQDERIILPDSQRLRDLMLLSRQVAVTILLETDQLLIADKPARLAVHAGQGHQQDNLTKRIEGLLKYRGENFMVAPIQRLDLDTSGPVLFGKGKKSCAALGRMMMTEPVEKCYLALVQGRIDGGGTLTTDIPAKGKMKTAVTDYQPIVAGDSASLLRINLQTGRQHQIRRQFQQIGHSLYGDRRYGGPCPVALPRLFLHCEKISFTDPFSGQPINVISPLPEELVGFLDQLEPRTQLPETPFND